MTAGPAGRSRTGEDRPGPLRWHVREGWPLGNKEKRKIEIIASCFRSLSLFFLSLPRALGAEAAAQKARVLFGENRRSREVPERKREKMMR